MYQSFGATVDTSGGVALRRAVIAPGTAFGRNSPKRRFDWTPDLGEAIGSRAWWRGLATCLGLCITALLLAPPLAPLSPEARPALDPRDFAFAREQAIAPLSQGSGTGRRMIATDAVQPLLDAPERPRLDLTATIGQGDSLRAVLQRAGVGAAEAALVVSQTAQVTDPARIAPGTVLTLTLGARVNRNSARPIEVLAFRPAFDARVQFRRTATGLVMQRTPIAVDTQPLRVTGLVGDGVYLSATAAGAPSAAAAAYIRALAPIIEFGALDPRARFDLIVERQHAETGEVRFGKLLYVGIEQGGRAVRMIEWTVDGRTGWYDPAGVGQTRPGYAAPISGARKTSGFGWRVHPVLGYSRMHQGVDYGAPTGTPIRAATDGVVSFAGWHGGHGKMVKLAHSGGLGTGYAHMSRIAVAAGERVSQGDVIGYVGSTGLSTGPHLHFEVYRGGRAVDPASVTFESTSLLSGAELAAFRARFAQIVATR